MKNIIIFLTLIMTMNTNVFASETCEKLSNDLHEVYSKRLTKDTWFTRAEVDWVMSYVEFEELHNLEGEPLDSFSKVRKNFENNYDELHVAVYKHEDSGERFIYVWSYPGDNQYGIILNGKSEIVANIGDSDVYDFKTGEYCDINEG